MQATVRVRYQAAEPQRIRVHDDAQKCNRQLTKQKRTDRSD